MGKSQKAYTLLEILIGMVVLSILAAMSVAVYQGYQDRAAMMVDETNQKVLAAAVKLYAYDNNALPASLSRLRPQDFDRAYAMVTLGKQRYTLLAYLKDCLNGEAAEAFTTLGPYYQNNARFLVCPSDRNGGVSYQINSFFASAALSVLLNSANQDTTLIFESDTAGNGAALTTRVSRHGGGTLSVETTVAGKTQRVPPKERTQNQGGGGGDSGNSGGRRD